MPLMVVFLLLLLFSVACFSWFIYFRVEVLRLSNAEALDAVTAQLGKVKNEILNKIAGLQAAAAAGEDLSGSLAGLVAAAQALDDVVPDEG